MDNVLAEESVEHLDSTIFVINSVVNLGILEDAVKSFADGLLTVVTLALIWVVLVILSMVVLVKFSSPYIDGSTFDFGVIFSLTFIDVLFFDSVV